MRKTVESCFAGHPDKVCDQIADALVDEYLRRDPQARLDLDVLGSHGMLMIGGEVASKADFDLTALARAAYADIGYGDEIEVFVNVEAPSEELASVRGPTDTCVVSGYATAETRERLPRAVVYAHAITRRLEDMRRTDPTCAWLLPDGKVQVSLEKDRLRAITLLASHRPDMDPMEVRRLLLERVIMPIAGAEDAQIFVNPAGPFTRCGFHADTGVNGRRLASDSYGGLVPFGDNAFSGKDPAKPERAGAYMARAAAKWIVDQGLASSVVVTAAYAFGRAEPIALEAVGMGEKTRGSKLNLTELVRTTFDFRPESIVERLDLRRPLYRASSVHGTFGRPGLPWEEPLPA